MASFDAYRVDGKFQFGRTLKSTEHSELRRPHAQANSWQTTVESAEQMLQPPQSVSPSQNESFDQTVFSGGTSYAAQPLAVSSSQSYQPAASTAAELPVPFSIGRSLALPVAESDADSFQRQIQQFLSDQVTPIRLASHLAVLAVAAVVLIVSQVQLPDWQVSLRSLPEEGIFTPIDTGALLGSANPLAAAPNGVAGASEAFQRAVVPFTEVQPQIAPIEPAQSAESGSSAAQRVQIENYVVRPGDTVLGIAAKFGIDPETIQWANPALEANPDLLRVGDRLVILPTDGVLHVVQQGDTLSVLAAKYKTPAQSIVEHPLNNLESANAPLLIGNQLVIPGGTKPYIPRQVATYSGPIPDSATQGSGAFSWPTAGSITQPFWNGHRAIDVGARTGTPVTAADSGYVITSRIGGWNSGYGNMVLIDHGNGYVTLYAHMNSIYVRQGENVSKGQSLGTVGNTGNSSGPHLHFEVRYQGVPRNPFTHLP